MHPCSRHEEIPRQGEIAREGRGPCALPRDDMSIISELFWAPGAMGWEGRGRFALPRDDMWLE